MTAPRRPTPVNLPSGYLGRAATLLNRIGRKEEKKKRGGETRPRKIRKAPVPGYALGGKGEGRPLTY